MINNKNDLPLVSKPEGNVDDCNPIQWLYRHYPGILTHPEKIKNITASIEKEREHFLITTYKLSKSGDKYLKTRILWKLEVDGKPVELLSTIYTAVKCPKDPENLREVAIAKSKVLMVAETYRQSLLAVLDPAHKQHHLTAQMMPKFTIMTHFTIDATPTGRIRSYKIATREKDSSGPGTYVLSKLLSPYFAVSKINDYESEAVIQDNGSDEVFNALREEKEGRVSRFLIDYYTICSHRYSQTFEEAYTRFIDVMAEDQVQRYILELRDMEAGAQKKEYSIEEIREKFDYVIQYVKEHHESSRHEYEIMKEAFSHLESVIDKFDSWREHPDLSLAQTSLLEAKINQLSKTVNDRRLLLTELRRRFEKIEYFAKWFKKQFPTLFLMLDE